MPLRRRPLLRAAAVGTVGYAGYRAGKGASQQSSQQQQAPPSQPAPPEQAAPPPAASAAPSDPAQRVQALAQLKTLLDSGAVTQEEYDRAKKGLLDGVS